ncbi:MAG: chemotaxis protein CheB [Bacteroidales bacterium]|nr:chemotaxis protein CheB [Bacteroidales bacterium]
MNYRLVIIGGSAGSFQVVNQMLAKLPQDFKIPIVLVLHRLKHVRHGFVEALSQKSNLPVIEPEDKSSIRPGYVYLAPANYHLFIEVNGRFALSTEEPVNHSRPAIDLSFKTAAYCFREKLIGIILSGANKDGAYGLKAIKQTGGLTIVQDPMEAQIPVMPMAAIERTGKVDHIFPVNDIFSFLCKL